MEYARNELGIPDADHGETAGPGARELAIVPLAVEEFRCGFGFNPAYRERLGESPLRVVGTGDDHEVRIVELPQHPFYLATLFLPQLGSRSGRPHPLIVAFLKAAASSPRRS